MALKVRKDRGNWASRNEEDEEPGWKRSRKIPEAEYFCVRNDPSPLRAGHPAECWGQQGRRGQGCFL